MGKTFSTGLLTNGIWQDASNNIGIGGSPSGSYKFEVTGTSNFTGALRTASTINMTGTGAQLLQTTANSVAGDNVMVLYNSNANSYGLYIGAGSGTNHALYITDSTRTANLFKVQGNGNVGIGTGSPVSLGANYTTLEIKGQSGLYGGAIQLTSADGTNKGRVYTANDTFWIGTSNSLPLGFITADTERMRINSNGLVQVQQAGNGHTTGGFSLINTISSVWNFVNGGDNNLYFGYNGSSKANISPTTGNYTALSDINKKKDFEESTIGLSAILNLKPTLYRMKEDDETSDKHLGFIAQEVKEFIPQAYVESGEFIGLNDRPIVAALVKAIQELNTKVSALENKA